MTDTPETDAACDAIYSQGVAHIPLVGFMEKLERQRDEALQLLRNIRSGWGGLITVDGCDCSDCEFLQPIDVVLTKYQND